ncbi:hypothetical protein HHI36_005757 [Cryptolaemus montrouzieri]|uniref:Gag protein n=1 Tax=Cryptolaemus montrouzieri TaxID=559131 RepID=A0ABD2NVZ5_9CUCU
MAERMLIKYDGDENKLHEFIDNCSMALSLLNNSNKKLLFPMIKSKICDRARLLMTNREFSDWDSLKRYLLDGYTDRRTKDQWQLELHSCKQGVHETVSSFANRVENCYIKLLDTLDDSRDRQEKNSHRNSARAGAKCFLIITREISKLKFFRRCDTIRS